MAATSVIGLKIYGKGGHSSVPDLDNNPIDTLVDCYKEIQLIISEFHDKGKQFTCSFPVIRVGTADNVIPDTAYLSGKLRTLEEGLDMEIINEITSRCKVICEKNNCKVDINYSIGYPVTINSKENANFVEAVGKDYFQEKVLPKDSLPLLASEDFSYYLNEIPGCFFFIGTGKTENQPNLHTSQYEFSDEIIEIASKFFMKILEKRIE